ncbi:MAG: hypothetical protein ACO1PM_08200 [Acidovorax sp.]
MLQQAPARTYRATLVPDGTCQDDIETLAALGKLPTTEVEAPSAYAAKKAARAKSGHDHIHSIEVQA